MAQSDTLTPLIRQFATRANTERDAPVQRPATAHTATHSRYFSDMVPEFEDEPDLYTLDGEPDYAADEEIPMWQVDYRTGEVTVRGRAEWVDVADYKDHDVWQNGNRGGFLIKQPATSLKPMF